MCVYIYIYIYMNILYDLFKCLIIGLAPPEELLDALGLTGQAPGQLHGGDPRGAGPAASLSSLSSSSSSTSS